MKVLKDSPAIPDNQMAGRRAGSWPRRDFRNFIKQIEEFEGVWRYLSPAVAPNLAFPFFLLNLHVFNGLALGSPKFGGPLKFLKEMDSIGPRSGINLLVNGTR